MSEDEDSYSDAPNEFLCPITQGIMEDPVITCDGHTYEKEAISEWLEDHDKSPLTNLTLETKRLIPNVALRSAIDEYKEKCKATHKKKREEAKLEDLKSE